MLGEPVDHKLPRHSLDRLLASRIDVGHARDICNRERAGEIRGQMKRARVQVRLEEHQHAPLTRQLAGSAEARLELGRVVAVVVDQPDAAGLPAGLQAPAGPQEAPQRPSGLVYCQSLAALNERLAREHFVPAVPFSTTSDYLLVPDLTTVDAE